MKSLTKSWTNPTTLLFLFFSLGGFLILYWSAWDWFQLMGGMRQEASFCSINSYWNCDRATLSVFGSYFSLPVGFFGALWFLAYGFLVLSSSSDRGLCRILRLLLGFFGVAAVFIMGFILLAKLKTGCIVCISSYIALIGAIVTGEKLSKSGNALIKRNTAWILFGLTLVGFVIFGLSNRHKLSTMIPEEEFKIFYSSLARSEVKPVSPMVRGNPSAPITVVEFSDFGCPFCAMASETLLPYLELQKDVKIVFFPYPLDGTCNPNLSRVVHPRSCEWSKAAICANEQGKVWELHDGIFKRAQELGELPILSETIGRFGLDTDKLSNCMKDPKTDDTLRQMIEVAAELKISSTPTFFVNGRMLKGLTPIQLMVRILEEMRKEVSQTQP